MTCLLDRGASVDVFDVGGQSPTHFTCGARMHRVAALVADRMRAVDGKGLQAAVRVGFLDVAGTLIERTGGAAAYAGEAAKGAFVCAGLTGSVAGCEWVLARWPDVPVRERRVCEMPLQRAAVWGNAAMVDYLLGLGAAAEFPLEGVGSRSMLEYALMHKQWAIVPKLIAHGASTGIQMREYFLGDAPAEVRALFG